MSLLLMMGGSDTPNTRSLFANNEAGLALDVGDRYGASESKRTWRRNLLTYSEGTVAQLGVSSNVTDAASTISGFANSIAFADNASQRFAYKVLGLTVGQTHTFSVYMQMDDASIPVPGATTGTGDFSLIVNSSIQSSVSVQLISGSLYRVSASVAGTTTAGTNFGIIKYTGQSNKTFRVTGYQLEQSSTPTEYQPITDFNTEFKAAYPTHSLYQDSNGVTPAVSPGDPVGLILDTARGGLDNLGPELVTTSVPATVLNGTPFLSGASVVAGKAYKVTYSVTENAGSVSASFRVGLSANFISGHTIAAGYTGTRTVYLIATAPGALNLYSDAAGTDLDLSSISVREIPGNHAYQTTSGSRPALARTPDGGRRNLLAYSEATTGATSGSPGTAPSGWSATSPVGTVATSVSSNGLRVTISTGGYSLFQTISVAANTTYCFSCICDVDTATAIHQMFEFIAFPAGATVTKFQDGVALSAFQAVSVRNNTKLELVLAVGATAGTVQCRFGGGINVQNDNMDVTFRQFQFEVGSTRTTYQKVGLTSDVTESGKRDCWGLLFDGSDDSLQTSEISFNTWTQATRRNLLTDTESFGVAGWVKTSTTVTDNTVISPDGTTTADSLNGSGAGSLSRVVYQNITRAVPATFSVYAKKGTSDFIQLLTDQANNGFVNFDLNNGTLSATTATGTITDVGNGWYRCSMAITSGSTFGNIYIGLVTSNSAARYEANTLTTTVYLWGAQLEAGTLTDYQRVGTDKMTVMAGVRKNSDAAVGMIVELTASLGGNNGSFAMFTPNTAAATTYSFGSRGSTAVIADSSSGFAAPLTSVATLQANIASDSVLGRLNSVQVATSSSDQGSGNYSNAIVYIGSRGGSSFRFNGILYTLIIRGATTPTGTIADFEKNLLRLRAGMGAF